MNATSENEGLKIYEMEKERALVARQLNIAKGRQALTIKKLKQQGFEVLPVPVPEQTATVVDSDSPTRANSDEVASPKETTDFQSLLWNTGLAILSAYITQLVFDYGYPRLRRYIMDDDSSVVIEPQQETVGHLWHNQSILK